MHGFKDKLNIVENLIAVKQGFGPTRKIYLKPDPHDFGVTVQAFKVNPAHVLIDL